MPCPLLSFHRSPRIRITRYYCVEIQFHDYVITREIRPISAKLFIQVYKVKTSKLSSSRCCLRDRKSSHDCGMFIIWPADRVQRDVQVSNYWLAYCADQGCITRLLMVAGQIPTTKAMHSPFLYILFHTFLSNSIS